MSSIRLYLQMAFRRKAAALLVILLAGVVTVFLLSYPRLIQRTEDRLADAYDAITVAGEVLHTDGHSTPAIPSSLWYALRDSGYLSGYQAGAAYTAVLPKLHELLTLCPGYRLDNPDLAKALSDLYTQKKKDNAITRDDPMGTVRGLSELTIYNPLMQVREDIQWAEGYDASCLAGSEAVALVPSNYGYALGSTMSLAFVVPAGYTPLQVKVVGLVPLSSESSVFLPLQTLENAYLQAEDTLEFSLCSLRFSLADSRDLPVFNRFLTELKSTLKGLHLLNIRLEDEIFHGTIDPIQSNLKMLQSLHSVFFLAVAAIGFVLCFLLVRRRKQEFAVMRLLGEPGGQITAKALLEQVMLCFLGVVLGTAAVLVSGLGEFSLLTCLGVLLCYSVGSAPAVMLMVRVNVMEILRDKE